MRTYKNSKGVIGNFSYDDLRPHEKEGLITAIRKGATRREVMGWMMAAGATVATAGSVFTGASAALAATPKRGGKIIAAGDQHGPKDTLDPILNTAAIDYFRGRMFYNRLVRLKDDLSYEPDIASEILPNADATAWTFKLNKGIEFTNGKSLDADDVIYTLKRHLGKDSKSNGKALVAMISHIHKVNSHEVRLELDSPNADLPMALGTFHFNILQNGVDKFDTAIGTGPYKCKEFKPGVRTIAVRNENCFSGAGYLDEIEHYAIGDSSSRLAAFLNGDVDMMVNVPPKAIPKVESTAGKDIWTVESGRYLSIVCHQGVAPSNNRDLIRAMQLCINRQRIVKGDLKGMGSLGNDQPIGSAYFDHSKDLEQRPQDLDKAKHHFQKSGIGNTEVEIIAAEVAPGAVEQCENLQREAKKIGMNLRVKKVTTDGYWGAVWMQGSPFNVTTWNMRPTANIMMTLAYEGSSKWNETFWKSEKFDKTLKAVRGVTDAGKRKQMYHDLQEDINMNGGSITPAHLNYTDGAASYIKGLTYCPLNNFGGSESPPYLWRSDA